MGRTVDMKTRGYVALAGTFGYELDITKLSDEDREVMKTQIEDYNKYGHLIREGDYYRIISSGGTVKKYKECRSVSWMFVSKDKNEALLTYVQERGTANRFAEIIKLSGLDANKVYKFEDGRKYTGEELMQLGFAVNKLYGDGAAELYHFVGDEEETNE